MLNPIEEIKTRLDIVEVVGSYIKLQKAGRNYKALCPFHSEKKPSFFVSPERQIWHCFGCGVGGDIFKFVMMIEGIEFGDALRILAQKAGVELKKEHPFLKTERKRLYEICELCCKFFEKQLQEGKVGKKAKEYLLKRGVSEESIKKWRLGYAPNTWHGLTDFLRYQGYKKEEIKNAGVGILTEDGNFYDRFRGRIMFPIFDLNSQVIGFGGRYFENPLRVSQKDESEVAKYINTPQTLLYDKSKVLYGLDKAKVEIRKKDFCILVEGYMDAILCSQSGWENVVAVSGTSLTPFQLKILKRYSDNLFTAFDMDVAGDSATKRGIELAQSEGFNIKVITMPQGKDPADVILENPQKWEERVKNAFSIVEFYFQTAFEKFDKQTPEGKREISKIVLPIIKRIPNKIEQAHWIGELAKRLDVKEEVIEEELKKYKIEIEKDEEGKTKEEEKEEFIRKPRSQILEERIGSLILKNPQYLEILAEEDFSFFSSTLEKIFNILKKKEFSDFSELKKEIPEESEFIDYLALKGEVEEIEDEKKEIEVCLKELKKIKLKEELDRISIEIKKAESERNEKEVEKLMKKFNDISSQLSSLN